VHDSIIITAEPNSGAMTSSPRERASIRRCIEPHDAQKLHSAAGRWVVAGSVLGSGAVFLESSVVNVALPAIARDFHVGVVGLQWVISGYLLTLSALMLLGGALGDRFGRARVFAIGCVTFANASGGCALAPSLFALVALRVVQGAAGALLVTVRNEGGRAGGEGARALRREAVATHTGADALVRGTSRHE
jgi:MFS family permease